MAVEVTKTSDPKSAFVLSKRDLSKFNEIIREYLGESCVVTFLAGCKDGWREFDTLAGIQEFENPRKKAIQRLTINGRSENYRKRVKVTLGGSLFEPNIGLEVAGQEASAQNSLFKLEEVCEGMKPWYSFFATARILELMTWFFSTLFILNLVVLIARTGFRATLDNLSKSQPPLGGMLVFLVVCFWGIMGTVWLRGLVFPRGVFAIGQGERRNDNLEKMRWGCVVALAVSVVGSLVTAVIWWLVMP